MSASLIIKISICITVVVLCFGICHFLFVHYNGILLRLGLYPVHKTDKTSQPTFKGRLIGFCGDSVTFGYSDDKDGEQLDSAWIKQIPNLLGCDVVNCGINSASVLSNTPTPKAWAKSFDEIPKQIDILGVMIDRKSVV